MNGTSKKILYLLTIGIIGVISVIAFVIWQLKIDETAPNSCDGDWSYWVKCPFGTTCTNKSAEPLLGGSCESWIFPKE